MRGEQEIKGFSEFVKNKITDEDLKKLLTDIPETKTCNENDLETLRLCFSGLCKAYEKWVLEGEPRYSVKELEKLCEHWANDTALSLDTEDRLGVISFLELLKDSKKVQEVLK